MFYQFFKYFLHYIFHAKTRQRLLFVAMAGLVISSFALIVLQSTMGGLQNNLMGRSKAVSGSIVLHLKGEDRADLYQKLLLKLRNNNLESYGEYELEMLMRYRDYLAPVVVHGIDLADGAPLFLRGHFLKDLLVPTDLAFRYGITPGDEVKLISTTHVDSLLSDIPRMATALAGDTFSTNVGEIDSMHLWVRVGLLHNLIRKVDYNRIRVYSPVSESAIRQLIGDDGNRVSIISWEKENNALVWALKLESTVMLSLFVAMTLLVSLSIISGLMIFYDKVKMDLASFWIMGAPRKRLEKSTYFFFNLLSLLAVCLGLGFGLLFLYALDHYAFEIMPDIFVDRQIPIYITTKGILLSVFIPYGISLFFVAFAVRHFDKDQTFLDHVRAVG